MVLARDRLGIKPLYYKQSGDRLAFASELKSLLASGLVDARLDYEAIGSYLHFGFFPGPLTPLLGVRKLMPGHRLTIDRDGVRDERYWEFPRPQEQASMTEEEAGERLLANLEGAVVRRLMSDVPLGAMLSGGLDSSLIVALMARNMSEPVKTFSVGFAEAGRDNELADARLVADAVGAEHHALELTFRDQPVTLEEFAWWLDEPLVDLGALGFLALSKLASSHVTVALSGQGADELLGGYSRYVRASAIGHASVLPAPVRAGGVALLRRAGGRYERFGDALAATNSIDRQLALRGPLVSPELARELATGELAAVVGDAPYRAVAAHAHEPAADPLSESMYLDSQLTLVDDMIHYFDRASMAHSLEVRVPFLDPDVVELCALIPNRLKVRGVTTKYLLKKVSNGLVPDSIIAKRKIGFFSGSARGWVSEQLRGQAGDYLLQGDLACGEFVDADQVRRMTKRLEQGEAVDLNALFAILMLELWLSSVLPRALAQGTQEPDRIALRI